MRTMAKGEAGFVGRGWHLLLAATFAAACSAAPDGENDSQENGPDSQAEQAASPNPDGLADAFNTFLNTFAPNDLDAQFRIGYGPHPGLATEKLKGPNGASARGLATLELNTGRVLASLSNVPSSGNFELWLVKNKASGTMAPESTDGLLKVGRFSSGGNDRTLDVKIGTDVIFDFDLIVVTRAGKDPTESRIALGDRTLFEKRLFRFRTGKSLDPVVGTLANNIETTDPLVARGAQLFFNETFGGNGRTCGTCHRAENNLTIDPAFIATLPQSDPLFVAENNPALAQLENPELLRTRGLILENLDGFDDPTHKFVMRGVPHTLSLGITNGISNAFSGPPDHRLGWSGDGGPGRSTLHEFTFGAIMQHFTKTLARRPGVDFRVPTQEELDALEAFQLFTGRQTISDFTFSVAPTDPRALNGQSLFNQTGCTFCHTDLSGFVDASPNFDTGVANLIPELPDDDGFGSPGDRTFNVPPLAEAADTPPFFHNNAIDTIENAVGFYFSPTFRASPSSFFIFSDLTAEQQGDLAAFLRVVNSATNIDQVRKRVQYVKQVRSAGNTDLLNVALADTRDARRVLADKDLSPDVQTRLRRAENQLQNAIRDRDRDRPSTMTRVLGLLDEAREALLTQPAGGGGGGFGGTFGMGGGSVGGSSFGGVGGGGDPGGAAGTDSGGSGPVGGTFTGGTGPTAGAGGSMP